MKNQNRYITPNIIDRQYTGDKCSLTKLILCEAEGSETCGSTLTVTPTLTSETSLINGTSVIYKLYLNDLSPDNHTFTINSNLILNFECIGFDLNSISFNLINGYYRYPLTSYNSYSLNALLRIDGIETSKPYSIASIGSFSFPQLSSCSFEFGYNILNYVTMNCFYSFTSTYNLSSPIELKMTRGSDSKSFFLDPILKDSEEISLITEVTTSPNNIENLIIAGYSQGPLIQIKTNRNYIESWYILSPNLFNIFYPISGNDSSTTFIFNIDSFGTSLSYNLYELNKNVYQVVQTINAFIPQYVFATPQINSIPTSSQYQNQLPIVNIQFTSNIRYSLMGFNIGIGSNTIPSISFPYGFVSGTNDDYTFSISSSVLPYYSDIPNIQYSIYASDGSYASMSFPHLKSGNSSYPPIVKNIEFYHIISDLYLYRITAEIPNSLLYFKSQSNIFGYETLASGNGYNGVFEIIFQKDLSIYLYDTFNIYQFIDDSFPISTNPTNIFKAPSNSLNNFDFYSIQDVSFLYSSVDVTNQRQFNILYFNLTNENIPKDTVFILVPLSDILQNVINNKDVYNENMFYSTYNSALELFEIKFYVESNTPSGKFQFDLVYNNKKLHSSSLSSQLIIKSSNMDLRGPIVKQMNVINPGLIDTNNNQGELKWTFTIEDFGNGFDYGYVIVRGEIDSSVYNFTFTSNDVLVGGNIYLGQYEFSIKATYPCVSQNYIISEVALYDKIGRISFFSLSASQARFSAIMNPFTELLDNLKTFNKLPITCSGSPSDTTPPTLDLFKVSTGWIDVSKTNRGITFTFKATDLESGIKTDQYPIVYLNVAENKMLECKSNITLITPNTISSSFGNTIDYSCTIQLPIGFGYPTGIYLSVYGFINNNAYFSGFTTNNLIDSDFTYFISTEFATFEPNIESYYRITEKGGDLWLFGRALWGLDLNTTAIIIFNDNTTTTMKPSSTFSSAILLRNVKATNKSYKVYIEVNGLKSNTITVAPILFDNFVEPTSSVSSSSSEMTPTETPLPTNAPQQCSGNPVCGGPSNGKCISNQGCVCYSPWIGLDCLSQVIIVDQPTTNDTSPSTNITLPVNNNNSNNSSTTVTYKSLITLVSIREINILGTVVFNKTFEKWQVRELDNTTFIYNTTLEIEKNNKVSTTDFKVTLKWFINETSITFANEQLIMNPSTMKYTIEINNYPFENNLNQLQLVMSASIQSNSSDNICSLREYGETTSGDNSNYLKIQVDNHSLYGRFIRRGIVDSTITTITNVLLDKDMNSITTTKELQSYIGIQIPNFKHNVIIDPDFSVILDSNSASSKSGSICSSKSKLSGAKIAGIVIGCVAFVSVIIVAVLYHIIKKKKDAQFVEKVNQKMKQMNNDKL